MTQVYGMLLYACILFRVNDPSQGQDGSIVVYYVTTKWYGYKGLQIVGLCTVGTAIVNSFHQLEEEEKCIRRLFPRMNQSNQ